MLDFENQNEAEVTDCYLESLAYFLYFITTFVRSVPIYRLAWVGNFEKSIELFKTLVYGIE